VYRHAARQQVAIRFMQEISEGIDQHPDPSHHNPNANCGSGRAPRLINALRGFLDVGFHTVEAINTPAFQLEFANQVVNAKGLSYADRLLIAVGMFFVVMGSGENYVTTISML